MQVKFTSMKVNRTSVEVNVTSMEVKNIFRGSFVDFNESKNTSVEVIFTSMKVITYFHEKETQLTRKLSGT